MIWHIYDKNSIYMISFNKTHTMHWIEQILLCLITMVYRSYIVLFLKTFCNIDCLLLVDVYSRIFILISLLRGGYYGFNLVTELNSCMFPLTLVTRTNPTWPFYFYKFDITQLFERKEFSQVQVSRALSSVGSSL